MMRSRSCGGSSRFSLALVAVLVVGCKSKAPPAPVPDAAVASASVAAAAPKPPAPPSSAIVERWNAAHNAHDADALRALYAARVQFYGKWASNKECVEAKRAAFAKSPDYAQKIRAIEAKPDGTVTFTKTSTIGGKSTDYPAVLVIKQGLVTAETDKITEANLATKTERWCQTDDAPNGTLRPPFKISAMDAARRARSTKHVAALAAARKDQFLDFGRVDCPTTCGDRAKRECGFELRLENHSPGTKATSNLVEWEYVDAVDATLWWEDETGWKSEPLPP